MHYWEVVGGGGEWIRGHESEGLLMMMMMRPFFSWPAGPEVLGKRGRRRRSSLLVARWGKKRVVLVLGLFWKGSVIGFVSVCRRDRERV